MVLLSIVPRKQNNTAGRSFPHSGYLGLSPVSVAGCVKTRLTDDDKKPIQASKIDIALRCYESRIHKIGNDIINVLAEFQSTLWQPPAGSEYADVADLNLPFKIVLPQDAPGYSTCHMPDYKIFWRVEATIHHLPIPGVGSRQSRVFEIPLIRYDAPTPPHLPTCRSLRLPALAYTLVTPSHSVAPSDPILISLKIAPTHPDAVVSRIHITLERRTETKKDSSASSSSSSSSSNNMSPLPTPPPTASQEKESLKGKPKELNLDMFTISMLKATKRTSAALFTSDTDTSSPIFAFSAPPKRTVSPAPSIKATSQAMTTLSIDKSEILAGRDEATGAPVYSTDLTTSLPVPKTGHWGMGETMSTSLIDIHFFVSVKIILTSSSSSHESIQLPPQEITVVAIDQSQRAEVEAKLHASAKAARLHAKRLLNGASSSSASSSSTVRAAGSRLRELSAPPPQRPAHPSSTASARSARGLGKARSVSPPPHSSHIALPSPGSFTGQLSPPSTPLFTVTLPPDNTSPQTSGSEMDTEDEGDGDKTPTQSRAPSPHWDARAMDLDANAAGTSRGYTEAGFAESDATLVHPCVDLTPSTSSSPFAWNPEMATPSSAPTLQHRQAQPTFTPPSLTSLPDYSRDDDAMYGFLGGDLNFTRPFRPSPQPAPSSTTSNEKSKSGVAVVGEKRASTSVVGGFVSFKRRSCASPSPAASGSSSSSPLGSGSSATSGVNPKAKKGGRGPAARLVAAMRKTSGLGGGDRPRTSSGIPDEMESVMTPPSRSARAGSVPAISVSSPPTTPVEQRMHATGVAFAFGFGFGGSAEVTGS